MAYTDPLGIPYILSFFKTFQLEYEIDPRVIQPSHGQERVEEWRMRSMQRKVQSKWSLPRCLQSIFCNSCLLLNEPAVVVDELEFQKCRNTFCKEKISPRIFQSSYSDWCINMWGRCVRLGLLNSSTRSSQREGLKKAEMQKKWIYGWPGLKIGMSRVPGWTIAWSNR